MLLSFTAGTSLGDGELVTAGGRVLAVTAVAETLQRACERAYTMRLKKFILRECTTGAT